MAYWFVSYTAMSRKVKVLVALVAIVLVYRLAISE